jgi:uncharacterized membrane protein YecN with MAPEG domain
MNDQDEMTCDVLWMFMQTYDKMDECFVAQIVNHLPISSEYVKFFVSNSSADDVVEANVWLVSMCGFCLARGRRSNANHSERRLCSKSR